MLSWPVSTVAKAADHEEELCWRTRRPDSAGVVLIDIAEQAGLCKDRLDPAAVGRTLQQHRSLAEQKGEQALLQRQLQSIQHT
jgi:hypothetical protein